MWSASQLGYDKIWSGAENPSITQWGTSAPAALLLSPHPLCLLWWRKEMDSVCLRPTQPQASRAFISSSFIIWETVQFASLLRVAMVPPLQRSKSSRPLYKCLSCCCVASSLVFWLAGSCRYGLCVWLCLHLTNWCPISNIYSLHKLHHRRWIVWVC